MPKKKPRKNLNVFRDIEELDVNKDRKCSLYGCRTVLDFRSSLRQFSLNWNDNIREKEKYHILEKFKRIWNNPIIAIFCCKHTQIFEKWMKLESKEKRLVNKSIRIIEKHKLKFNNLKDNEKKQ